MLEMHKYLPPKFSIACQELAKETGVQEWVDVMIQKMIINKDTLESTESLNNSTFQNEQSMSKERRKNSRSPSEIINENKS